MSRAGLDGDYDTTNVKDLDTRDVFVLKCWTGQLCESVLMIMMKHAMEPIIEQTCQSETLPIWSPFYKNRFHYIHNCKMYFRNCKMYLSELQNVFVHIQLWDKLGNQVWKTDRDSAADLKPHLFRIRFFNTGLQSCNRRVGESIFNRKFTANIFLIWKVAWNISKICSK